MAHIPGMIITKYTPTSRRLIRLHWNRLSPVPMTIVWLPSHLRHNTVHPSVWNTKICSNGTSNRNTLQNGGHNPFYYPRKLFREVMEPDQITRMPKVPLFLATLSERSMKFTSGTFLWQTQRPHLRDDSWQLRYMHLLRLCRRPVIHCRRCYPIHSKGL